SRLCARFFFFQAEDGIRDLYVTGVQTCALPIYFSISALVCRHHGPDRSGRGFSAGLGKLHTVSAGRNPERVSFAVQRFQHRGVRSEERRVGKECRCQWSPRHYKTKKNGKRDKQT